MTALSLPDVRLHRSWAAAMAESADEVPHGSGHWNLPERERVRLDESACRSFVTLLAHLADPETTYLDDTVPSWYFWITDDADEVVGFLAFRHRLNDWLLAEGGHIGYSVRASRRREGHASAALALAVRRAPELGVERVLVTCDIDNLASAATIEANGGVLEDERSGKRRYWISAGASD
jgi:predicted acetyltransferase